MSRFYENRITSRSLSGILKLSLLVMALLIGFSPASAQQGERVTVSNDMELSAAMDNQAVNVIVLQPGSYELFDLDFTDDPNPEVYRLGRSECFYNISSRSTCYPNNQFVTVSTSGTGCPSVDSGEWSIPSGATNVTGTDVYNIEVSVDAPGEYSFTYIWPSVTPQPSVSAPSYWYAAPVADRIEGDDVCDLETSLEGFYNSADFVGVRTYSWTSYDSGVVFGTPEATTTTVTVPSAGEYTFYFTVASQDCGSSTVSETFEFFDVPTQVTAFGDDVCGKVAELMGTFVVDYGTPDLEWSLVSGPGTADFDPVDAVSTTVTVSEYGEYVFQFEVTNGLCPPETATVTVEFFDTPEGLEATGENVCGPNAELEGSHNPIQHGIPSYEWSKLAGPGPVAFGTQTGTSTTVELLDENGGPEYGVYTFVYSVTNGPCGPVSTTVTIEFFPVPDPLDLIGDDMVCELDEVVYEVISPDPDNTLSWSLSGGGTILTDPAEGVGLVSVTILWLEAGTHTITVIESNEECTTVNTFEVEVLEIPVPEIDGPLEVKSGAKSITYTLSGEGISEDSWIDWWAVAEDDLVDISGNGTRTVTLEFEWPLTGEVELWVTVFNGPELCFGTTSITITVLPNQIVGQVKYYNTAETPMPSPFNTNFDGMTQPDYFWVMLVTEQELNAWTPTLITQGPPLLPLISVAEADGRLVKVQEYYGDVDGESYPLAHPLLVDPVYEAAFAFDPDLNLDPAATYYLFVWDGGYLEETGEFGGLPGYGALGHNWTWNNWGGVNATDALLVQVMSAGLPIGAGTTYNQVHIEDPYNFFAEDVADVNAANGITALDALLTQRRGIGLIQRFPNDKPNFAVAGLFVDEPYFNKSWSTKFGEEVPDIQFSSIADMLGTSYHWSTNALDHAYMASFNITMCNPYLNIYYNAVGDINSSYQPQYGGFKDWEIDLIIDGSVPAAVGQEVTLPVSMDRFAELGAISIGMNYRNDLIEVLHSSFGEDNTFVDHEGGVVKMGWADMNGASYTRNTPLVQITVRVLDDIPAGTQLFELRPFTELADPAVKLLDDISLYMPGVTTDDVVGIEELESDALSLTNFPNPFREVTNIRYTLPEAGHAKLVVYNKTGQVVKTLVDQFEDAGTYEVTLRNADLVFGGVYYYRLDVQGESRAYSSTRSLILIR